MANNISPVIKHKLSNIDGKQQAVLQQIIQ